MRFILDKRIVDEFAELEFRLGLDYEKAEYDYGKHELKLPESHGELKRQAVNYEIDVLYGKGLPWLADIIKGVAHKWAKEGRTEPYYEELYECLLALHCSIAESVTVE